MPGESLSERELSSILGDEDQTTLLWERLTPTEKIFYIQAGLLVLSQIADSATTIAAINNMAAQELNNLLGHIIESGGFVGLSAFKIAGIGILAITLELRRRKHKNEKINYFSVQTLRLVNTFFATISLYNLHFVLLQLISKLEP